MNFYRVDIECHTDFVRETISSKIYIASVGYAKVYEAGKKDLIEMCEEFVEDKWSHGVVFEVSDAAEYTMQYDDEENVYHIVITEFEPINVD